MFYNIMFSIFVVSVLFMLFSWMKDIGFYRAIGAATCRFLWMLPVLLALKPSSVVENSEQPINQESMNIFIDDTKSMLLKNSDQYDHEEVISLLTNRCKAYNCIVNITKYSDLLSTGNFTDLNHALELFLMENSGSPWIIYTDGKDKYPRKGWVSDIGEKLSSRKGLVIGTNVDEQANYFIEKVYVKPIAFKNKPVEAQVRIRKTAMSTDVGKFQLQISHSSGVIKTTTGEFSEGSDLSVLDITLPPLATGSRILKFEVLSHPAEKASWDNVSYHPITVMENTEGVLHILGSPSWDGRYMRRFIKSEPKFDAVSFFILRDPTDSNTVSEREMSLIPFPVSTLFDEELPNFKLVVMQDFSISMFLQNPKLQKNLVDFVKNGGGFLFTGGKRALLDPDILDSPMAEILPFKVKSALKQRTNNQNQNFPLFRSSREVFSRRVNKNGPWYDSELKLRVAPRRLTSEDRSLVPFMYEWNKMAHIVFDDWTITGAHHMENVVFKSGVTTLFEGHNQATGAIPLAVASYPGNGRAVWFFTDQLSEITRGDSEYSKAYYYNQFVGSLTTWLTRNERNRPISLSSPRIKTIGDNQLKFSVLATGPAVSELSKSSTFQYNICGKPVDSSQVMVEELGNDSVNLLASVDSHLAPGSPCRVTLTGTNKNGGKIEASGFGVIPDMVPESAYVENSELLRELGEKLSVKLLANKKQVDENLDAWFLENFDESLVLKAKVNRSIDYHYWPLDLSYIWLLLFFIPGEIIFRRLHEILS